MPTTPNGTVYTVTNIDLGAPHGQMHYGAADAVASTAAIPAVLYCHGDGGAADQFASLSAWAEMRAWLIDNGWAWVEGSGGATGARGWGNVGSRAAYLAYLDRAADDLDIGVKVLLGRSMGGLVSAWLYAKSGVEFDGWINNSGVSTCFVGTRNDPDTALRPSGQYFQTGMHLGWGVSSYADLQDAVAAADAAPETWDPSVWSGKKILNCYGDNDLIVPWDPRGAGPLRALWAGQPAVDEVSVRIGGDHSQPNGSYTDVAAMSAFLSEIAGGPPPEPVEPTVYRVIDAYLVSGGERYRMTAPALS